MPPQQKVLDFYVRISFPKFHPPPTLSRPYNITERLTWTERPAMSLVGSEHPASVTGVKATMPNSDKEGTSA